MGQAQQAQGGGFEKMMFEDYVAWINEQDRSIALIKFDHQYVTMNVKHAEFFGFENVEQALLVMKNPADFSPERQANGKLSSEAVMDNARATMSSETGKFSFNWTHQDKDGAEKRCTIVLTQMRFQSLYAFQAVIVNHNEFENPSEDMAPLCRNLAVVDVSMIRSTCTLKPRFKGEGILLQGSFFADPTPRSVFYDCTGRNLFYYDKAITDETVFQPEGVIRIDAQTLIRNTENPKCIELIGPVRCLFRVESPSELIANELKEIVERSVEEQKQQATKPVRELIGQLVDMIEAGTLLKAFETLYDDSLVMSENLNTAGRVGIHANRKYEQNFMSHVNWKAGRKAGRIAVDEDAGLTAVEWFFKFEVFGFDVDRTQIAIAEWKDGKIVREDFFYTNEFASGSEFPSMEELRAQQRQVAGLTTPETAACAQIIIDGFSQGKIKTTFDENYHNPDCVMTENGKARVGFQANHDYEFNFMDHVEWVQMPRVGRKIIDGNLAVVEWFFEFDLPIYNLHVNRSQIAVELWTSDKKVVREDFYYESKPPADD